MGLGSQMYAEDDPRNAPDRVVSYSDDDLNWLYVNLCYPLKVSSVLPQKMPSSLTLPFPGKVLNLLSNDQGRPADAKRPRALC